MIIFGVRTTESTVAMGAFPCPRCHTAQSYRHVVHKRWFTLYFIPVIPLGRAGEQIECQGCFSRFFPDVLAGQQGHAALNAVVLDEFVPQPAVALKTPLPPRTSSLAVTSLILGLLSPVFLCVCGISLLTSLGAIIAGHTALIGIKRSAGQLAGRGIAVTGLVLGYLLFVVTLAGWTLMGPTLFRSWQSAQQQTAQQRSQSPPSAEDRLRSAEMQVLTPGAEGVATGNSPTAKELADHYARALKVMRHALFSEERDRVFSLTDGQFIVHGELHPGRCMFLVHVPSYRDFTREAKEALEVSAWQLAQQTVKETLRPGDALAVGLRGTATYGAVLVGQVARDDNGVNHFTRGARHDLLAFFPDASAPLSSAFPAPPEPDKQVPGGLPRHVNAPFRSPEPVPIERPGEGRLHSPLLVPELPSPPPQTFDDPTNRAFPPPSMLSKSAQPHETSLPRAAETPPAAEASHGLGVARRFPDMGWPVESLAFSPNGRFLAVGKLDSKILLLDVTTGKQLQALSNLDELGQVVGVAFSFDGGKLFAGGSQGALHVWDIDAAGHLEFAGMLRGHTRSVTSLVTSPVAPFVLSGSAAGDLLWQAYDKPSQEPRTLAAFERPVLAAHLPQSGFEAVATDGRRLIRFDVRGSQILKICDLGGSGTAQAAAISRDGSQLATSAGYDIRLSDTATGKEITTLSAQREIQWSIAFLPNRAAIISGGRGKATVWNLPDGRPLASADLGGVLYVKSLAVTNDGLFLAAIPSSAGQSLSITRLSDMP